MFGDIGVIFTINRFALTANFIGYYSENVFNTCFLLYSNYLDFFNLVNIQCIVRFSLTLSFKLDCLENGKVICFCNSAISSFQDSCFFKYIVIVYPYYILHTFLIDSLFQLDF